MYQYSRAIYRSIKDLIDPYASREEQLDYRRAVLEECERTMTRLADDPHYFARPDRSLFAEILAMSGDGCGRQIVRRHREDASAVAWPADRLADVDVPADLAHAL